MTMIDPFSHDHIISNSNHNYYYYADNNIINNGMSRSLQRYDHYSNYAQTSSTFLVADQSSSSDHNYIEAAAANYLVDFGMADNQYSRTTQSTSTDHDHSNEPPPPPAASTSRDHFEQAADHGGGWLNLALGRHVTNNPPNVLDPTSSPTSTSLITRPPAAAGLLELTLLPGSTTTNYTESQQQPSTGQVMMMMSPPNNMINSNSMFQQLPAQGHVNYYSAPRHQDLNLVFRPSTTITTTTLHHHDMSTNIPLIRNFQSLAAAAAASNYNFLPTSNSTPSNHYNYFTSPTTSFPAQLRPTTAAASARTDGPASFDFRVISPPRRPHSGLWFTLQASQTHHDQSKEPFLPQIPKSYLRIKDGRMTVSMLMKYLVNKLNLGSESEIEIRCRGQQLVPVLTLQYVRDNIWRSRDTTVLTPTPATASSSSSCPSSPASVTTDHVMLLHYSRTSIITSTDP